MGFMVALMTAAKVAHSERARVSAGTSRKEGRKANAPGCVLPVSRFDSIVQQLAPLLEQGAMEMVHVACQLDSVELRPLSTYFRMRSAHAHCRAARKDGQYC